MFNLVFESKNSLCKPTAHDRNTAYHLFWVMMFQTNATQQTAFNAIVLYMMR